MDNHDETPSFFKTFFMWSMLLLTIALAVNLLVIMLEPGYTLRHTYSYFDMKWPGDVRGDESSVGLHWSLNLLTAPIWGLALSMTMRGTRTGNQRAIVVLGAVIGFISAPVYDIMMRPDSYATWWVLFLWLGILEFGYGVATAFRAELHRLSSPIVGLVLGWSFFQGVTNIRFGLVGLALFGLGVVHGVVIGSVIQWARRRQLYHESFQGVAQILVG
jgi:hypothetical protein